MGVNDEYSRDAYSYELAYDSDGSDEFDHELDPEVWQDMYSGELLDGWMHIREYLEGNYLQCRAGFPQFVELVLEPSKWYTTQEPGQWQLTMWELIKDLPVVGERLDPQNFYAWTENYVDYL
jgi:hypothetical protein